MENYIQQTLVFIGSAIVLVPIFKHLGFGSVLGYLIAGIVVGPHGLKFIADAESVMHFAEIGVVLLLFMIGLEIQPFKLWSMRKHLLGLGGLQVLITTIAFGLIGKWFGLSDIAAVLIGFSMALSSTAFALQTLTERNQFNTEFGRSSFSILLMQDLVAIPALAIIPVLTISGSGETSSWFKILGFFGILMALILISRYLIRPIFRILAGTHTQEIFTAATLFIVLGVAVLMQKIGLSAALGTFIAGVLLAESEYRHEIEANLDPFKSLLMGLFFISVGMSVSLDLIVQNPTLILSMAIGYLIVKMAIIYGIGRLFKLNHENSKLTALNIAQGGEFAFVIFGMLATFQLTSPEIIMTLTAVITISMALNPVFSKLNEKFSCTQQKNKAVYDQIKDESPHVIIAGFGRFGQMFGRVMRAQGIGFVAIDHDSSQIELLRKFGSKVYYGDASRADLLEAAGAAKAKYFVLAVDGVEESMQIVKTVKEHFPNLKIFARARNRGHVFDLMDEGITHIKRETFDSSIFFVKDLLIEMGFEPKKAKSLIERFKDHDELMMVEQYKVRHDDQSLVSVSKQGVAQLAQVLSNEAERTYVAPVVPQEPETEEARTIN
jgi:monovalent cation:proton antiporter-2 (CPA2) family protein